jgi:hypothetical protein
MRWFKINDYIGFDLNEINALRVDGPELIVVVSSTIQRLGFDSVEQSLVMKNRIEQELLRFANSE